ncbi:MAG: hypothetical protein J0L75_11640 [Spirochaetes bacterium]|nr:hypothetical protein [Spirochaetota bacterium]
MCSTRFAFLFLLALPAFSKPFDLPALLSPTPQGLVPKGWSVELSVEGDLDGDGTNDIVLVLLRDAAPTGDRPRALVVALRTSGAYRVVGRNRGLLADFQGLGIKGGDATPVVSIKRKVLNIEQTGGSRETYSSTHRFYLDETRSRLHFIGLDETFLDSVTGKEKTTSENLWTGDFIATRTPPQIDDEGKPTGAKTTSTNGHAAPKPLRVLEDVKKYGNP